VASERRRGTFSDVLRSVAVLAALLLGLALVGKFFTVEPDHAGSAVDPAAVVGGAAKRAGVPLWAPRSLPEGWRATAAELRGEVWHVGVVTDEDNYIGLEQAKASEREAVRQFAPESRASGQVSVAGRDWARRVEADGDTVYVRREGNATLLVIGSAPRAQIERYISSLVASS
jgi:hypothetical protein